MGTGRVAALVVLLGLFGCGASEHQTSVARIAVVTQSAGDGSGGQQVVVHSAAQVANGQAVVVQQRGAVVPGVVVQGGGGAWLGGATAQSRVLVGSDGQTYVGLWVEAPQQAGVAQRAPVDLALVIDTSGSMSGDKIANARMAAASVVETLHDGDIVSVYTFNNAVEEIASPTLVNAASRGSIIRAIQMIQPMGGTNLYDGLRAGVARVGQAPQSHPVRRVIVISDGIANIGPSSPEALGDVAAQGTENGAQVSAIGVGLDYDERTLGALAQRSAGRMYHLEEPSQMATILRNELNLLAQTVATEAYIEVVPAEGVQILGVEGLPATTEQGRVRVRLGSLYGGQRREILVRARVATHVAGDRPLADARLVFREPNAARAERVHNVGFRYAVTRDAAAAQASADARVQAMVANYEATQAQVRAAEALNRDDNAQAEASLQQAEERLRRAAAAAPAPVRMQLERRAASIQQNRVDASRATSRPARRSNALRNYDAAMDAQGF